MADNVLAFDKLPKEIQDRLIELQARGEGRFAFIPPVSRLYWLAMVGGFAWCVYLFISTQNYLWEGWMFALFAAGSLVFVSLALYALYRILSQKFARLKDGYVFTTDECIRTSGDRVEFWSLRELEGFSFREDIKTIEIWIGERVKKIKAENAPDAEHLERVFVEWRNEAGESFLSRYAKPETAYRGGAKTAATVGAVLVFLSISFGVSYAAKIVNRNYDDRRTWSRLQNGTTVAEFEEYKQRHPNGAHTAEANQKIADIYSKIKDDYAKKVKPSADPSAVAALSELLETAGRIPNRTVYVRVRETRELDDAVVKKMRQATGISINTYDYSIPPADEKARREKLLQDVGLAFLPATRNASINFEMSDNPPAGTTTLDVNYVARSVENFYQYFWYSNGSRSTFYNPAAEFHFDFVMRAPDGREIYKTNHVSTFVRPVNTGLVDSRDAANYSFDKMYFAAVSADFTNYLGRQFGFID